MVKDIAKCFLSLCGWCVVIVAAWGGGTLLVCWLLNFGRPL